KPGCVVPSMITESMIFGRGIVRLIVKVLVAAPAWTTVKVWPAIVKVPDRVVGPVLAITVKLAKPFPLPLPPLTMMKLALLVAVQAQPLGVVTATDALPPSAAKL